MPVTLRNTFLHTYFFPHCWELDASVISTVPELRGLDRATQGTLLKAAALTLSPSELKPCDLTLCFLWAPLFLMFYFIIGRELSNWWNEDVTVLSCLTQRNSDLVFNVWYEKMPDVIRDFPHFTVFAVSFC